MPLTFYPNSVYRQERLETSSNEVREAIYDIPLRYVVGSNPLHAHCSLTYTLEKDQWILMLQGKTYGTVKLVLF